MALRAHAILTPEILSAKSYLEGLLTHRYTQGISAIADKQYFSVATQLELTQVPKKSTQTLPERKIQEVAAEPISDLMLGTIDPEELLKKYSSHSNEDSATAPMTPNLSFLENFKIKSVSVSVGLKDNLTPEIKTEIETWLKNRLNSEFGASGKSNIYFIKAIAEKKTPPPPMPVPKSPLDWIQQFQTIAGQLILAASLIFGILLWRVLFGNTKNSRNQNEPGTINMTTNQVAGEKSNADLEGKQRHAEADYQMKNVQNEIQTLSTQIAQLVPKMAKDFENIIINWCQMGEAGQMKLACFAEAVGKDIGKLPIPVDALIDVTKVFQNMTGLAPQDKKDILQKTYWDLLSVLNLGMESLSQPFSYLGRSSLNSINQILIDENPKLKTLVSLYLPQDLRSRLMKSMTEDEKQTLLQTAADLSEIPSDELKGFDLKIKNKFKPQVSKDTIPLDMTLNKFIPSLSMLEEIKYLQKISGPSIEIYKQNNVSLAFINQWPEDKLKLLIQSSSSDELLTYLRVCSEDSEKFLSLSPQLTAEMVRDELSREDRMHEKDKIAHLTSLKNKASYLVKSQQVILEDIFIYTAPTPHLGLVNDNKRAS